MTKYAETDNVIAALQGGANNFVRKTDSFERKALCIQTAWRHAQALRNAERGREEFWDMLRSEASRIYADDLAAALNVTRLQLGRIARQIESGDVSATETAPEKIRKAFADLWRNYEQIASSIPGATEKPDNIDVVEQIVRPLTEIYPGPVTITEEPKEPLFLRIYRSDVKFTLHELVRNALEYGGGQVEIRVRSLTDGSAAEILILNPGEIDEKVCTGMFDRGVTSRPEDPRHIGMGLYLARRMMRSTGGEVELADPQPDRPGWVGMTVRIKSQGGQ
jgi:signal transduction histidine kinase